jgi:hypothetical protein
MNAHVPRPNALAERALLASLRTKAWTGRKKDKTVTAEVTGRYHAEDRAASVTKKLIECEEFDAVMSVISKAGETHRSLTLPWLDGPKGAPRILAVEAYPKYTNTMRDHCEALEAGVRAFAAVYPEARRAAQHGLLGKMWDEEDYPDEIESRFAIKTSLSPVPDARDWRVALGDEDVAILRADVEAQAQEAMTAAARDAYERVAAVVGKMAATLRAYQPQNGDATGDRRKGPRKGSFKDTLISNVSDLAEILPLLNVTRDPALDAIATRMKAGLTFHDPNELREYEHLRAEVATEAESILRDIQSFLA